VCHHFNVETDEEALLFKGEGMVNKELYGIQY